MNKELKEQVIIEANNLKKHATKEELNKLDFNYLKPSNIKGCIYGQMTGDCFSDRAGQLILSCANGYYSDIFNTGSPADSTGLSGVRNFSAIEVYIYQIGANHEALIDYLKGERDSLTIKDL